MKFTHSTTEHRLLFRASPEKMPQPQEAHVESRAEISDRWEKAEKRVQEKLGMLEQQIASLPEGSKERTQREIAHRLLKQEYQAVTARLERLEGQRRSLEQTVSDRLTEWETAESAGNLV